ncbi:DASH complex subunit Dad1-domain-containing protein [Echria macrotheca]|uniref:DASH complex subunit DAD1 n=1 Tax=Echria macrotheca TaxID=438768 RepID=A0AAJ0BN74_9PEZI|nr:DASH complex subunit Dad1-domain-containing protein [Echria macrotheca]
MASRSTSAAGTRSEKTYFEQQREELMAEIALSFEHVLANINKLNRSLEAVITVGNEFSSVEALWSQFENVMGNKEEETTETTGEEDETGHEEGETETEQHQQHDESDEKAPGKRSVKSEEGDEHDADEDMSMVADHSRG